MIDSSAFQGKTASYYTLGCKLNFSETSTFAKLLEDMGVRTVSPHPASSGQASEKADICLINTCSVTDVADRKCRQAIRRMVKENPGAFMVVTGCYAQLESDTIAKIPGVNLVLGSNEKANLIEFLSEHWGGHVTHTEKVKDIKAFQHSCSRGNRTRYWLKVQDGCNYYCTYCTIPFARGNSRNPSIASLVAQAEQAAREGGKEIVLTGVNIGDFGQIGASGSPTSTYGESFLDLVKALDNVYNIKRYRISSLEPDLITDELIDYCAHSRAFMPHFHIPLQSGSDTVLQLMHRHYNAALFADKIKKIKTVMPEAFIGVDVMVGCRGETPECFEETYALLDSLPVTQLHVFPYSERPGTAALKIPYIVSDKDKKLRSKRLLELSAKKTLAFYEKHIGTTAEVLFEKASNGRAMHGFTENYIRVELPAAYSSAEYDNEILTVKLRKLNYDKSALIAEICAEREPKDGRRQTEGS